MFSDCSKDHWAVLQLPCCPSNLQELSGKYLTKPPTQVAAAECTHSRLILVRSTDSSVITSERERGSVFRESRKGRIRRHWTDRVCLTEGRE